MDPIPMLLWCPECGARHVDEGEFATKSHHTHSCQTCGMTWRPAVVPTTGVQFLPGFRTGERPPATTASATPAVVADPRVEENRLCAKSWLAIPCPSGPIWRASISRPRRKRERPVSTSRSASRCTGGPR